MSSGPSPHPQEKEENLPEFLILLSDHVEVGGKIPRTIIQCCLVAVHHLSQGDLKVT